MKKVDSSTFLIFLKLDVQLYFHNTEYQKGFLDNWVDLLEKKKELT
ncbi:hypothetical protein OVS_00965 [Mycoplasma ovis str. Michigan]|uniref:Transposase n=1 Tax=Mycoplasma ovis str. Michigan TaxID=1415773 RepID=A0ABM5P166_9MOLU|nr:hypothetical protein OVS_00965 [Mycoplasma ovis str. Michigan]